MAMDYDTRKQVEESRTWRTLIYCLSAIAMSLIGGVTYVNSDGKPRDTNPRVVTSFAELEVAKADQNLKEANELLTSVFKSPDSESQAILLEECVQKVVNAYRVRRELMGRPSTFTVRTTMNDANANGCECDTCKKVRRVARNPVDTRPPAE